MVKVSTLIEATTLDDGDLIPLVDMDAPDGSRPRKFSGASMKALIDQRMSDFVAAMVAIGVEHEWTETSVRFRAAGGEWGDWVDVQGPTGPQGPVGAALAPRGAWDSATVYNIDEVVTFAGSAWRSIEASLNVEPGSDVEKWELFVSQGAPYAQVDILTASGTWVPPTWASRLIVYAVGGGGGGGAGRRGAAGTDRAGGGGGQAGGLSRGEWLLSELTTPLSVVISTTHAGGAAASVNDNDGVPGFPGGATLFVAAGVTVLRAGGGSAGGGGGTVSGLAGTSEGYGSHGQGNFGSAGLPAEISPAQTLPSPDGPGGGGGGGGIPTGDISSIGGAGANGHRSGPQSAGGSYGVTEGGVGGAGANRAWSRGMGAGGGGGAGSITGAAGAGGDGGFPGGGGGGGGASLNGSNSGAGGAGGAGAVYIISIG